MNSVQGGADHCDHKSSKDDEDIGADAPSEKNWKGIIIAVLVICFVLGMIITSILLLTPPDLGPRVRGERITLEQILGDDFTIKEFNGSWVSGKKFVYKDANEGISIFNAEDTSSRVIVSNVTVHQLNVEGFNVSADLKYVLLAEKVRKIHQYSYTSKYHIYDIVSMHPKSLTHQPEERGHPDLVYAKWAPVGSALVMVDTNYNIFYKKSALGNDVFQLTDTGKSGIIYNGASDWIYESEILGDHFATWFSPDGEKLAYATFNDTNVEELPIIFYGKEKQYSTLNNIKYPKAGQTNPSVTIWVVDLTGDLRSPLTHRDVKPPNGVKDQDHYFTSITWLDNQTLSIIWMNRAQNISIVTLCKPPLYFCEATHTESAHHGWVDLYEAPIFSSDGQSFLVRLPVRSGDSGEFKHLNLYNTRLHMVNPITHGAYEVTEILGWDHDSNFIFFMGTSVDGPGDRHLYRIAAILSSAIARTPDCVSCFEAENSTEKCLYNKAHMSPDYSYFVLECLGPDVPRTYLYSTWDLEQRYVLNNYDELRNLVEETALPEVKTFKVELEIDSAYTANVQLLLPPGLREDEITTYPMVIHAFGSPGSQSVDSRLRFHYGTYLASKRDIIYGLIDGRGSGFQGDKLKHEVFLNLGDKEVMDLLAVVRYLKENLHFIDEKRIVIWGQNYGGYVTAMALAKDADDMFSCGIAVSPITRWEHYNSAFTERYMGSPHAHPGSNYKGYESGDATKVAGNIKNSKLLMIHGTADRKVPFLHTMMLSKALMHEGIIFKQIVYTDEENSLEGVREHLYVSMDKFMSDCFRPSIEELYFHIKKKRDLEEIGYL